MAGLIFSWGKGLEAWDPNAYPIKTSIAYNPAVSRIKSSFSDYTNVFETAFSLTDASQVAAKLDEIITPYFTYTPEDQGAIHFFDWEGLTTKMKEIYETAGRAQEWKRQSQRGLGLRSTILTSGRGVQEEAKTKQLKLKKKLGA